MHKRGKCWRNAGPNSLDFHSTALALAIKWLEDSRWPVEGWHGGEERVAKTADMPSLMEMDLRLLMEAFERAVFYARGRLLLEAFTEGVRAGRCGFATETKCRWSNEPVAHYSITAAGDIQQHRWRRIHGFEGKDDFGHQWCQSWISGQLRLPQLIHGTELGEEVARWAQYQLADHAAAATLIFPPTLLHVFMSLHVRLYRDHAETMEVIRSENARGKVAKSPRPHLLTLASHPYLVGASGFKGRLTSAPLTPLHGATPMNTRMILSGAPPPIQKDTAKPSDTEFALTRVSTRQTSRISLRASPEMAP